VAPLDFTYELRQQTDFRDGLETLYRKSQLAKLSGDYTQAESAVNQLIELHPVSVDGYCLRAEIAERTGRRVLAIQSLERAAVLLSNGSDELLAARLAPRAQRELHENILKMLASLRAARQQPAY
jgi:DNA-binding SARP family transcriptional activator